MKHQEGTACVGAAWEDDIEGGGGAGHVGEVLLRVNTGGDVV